MNATAPRPAIPQSTAAIGKLATLVHLERRARAAGSIAELGFVIVNETHGLLPFRQAMLLANRHGGGETLKLSAVAAPDPNAPFACWIRDVLRHLSRTSDGKVRNVTAAELPDKLARDWSSWLPEILVVVPLRHGDLELGILALGCSVPAGEADTRILTMAADAYAHAWDALIRGGTLNAGKLRPTWRRMIAAAAIASAALLGLIPVPSAVLAPAEVIPVRPAIVRSALDGVIESIAVQPNHEVAEGQVLVRLDPRRLHSQLQAARMAAAAADAELRQARQTAVTDLRARAQIPALQGRADQQVAEVRFLESQEERLTLRAPRAGIAVFDNVHDWIGRPVGIGERIMQIADPTNVELEIRLPFSDAIEFAEDAEVLFFRNVDPDRPTAARLSFIGYRAVPGPDGIVAYRLKARFDPSDAPLRIGLKGTAKIYGPSVSLGYYIFRRPLAAARVALGL
jgi:hypothetical protein